jgi:hypothetical protein
MRAQRLALQAVDPAGDVARVVRECGGMQAQDASAAALAVRARSLGLTAADVDRARVEERTIVRTWAMRGTLHLVATADLDWLLALFGPVFIRAGQRRRAALGLDDTTCARGVAALRDTLAAEGPLTRAALVERLAPHGIRLAGQAAPHLLAHAALQGIVCYGPDEGREPTYVLLDDWLPRHEAVAREAALGELARRYLAAYGPAGPTDLAAWTGLPQADVRAAWQQIADELIAVTVAGRPAALLKTRAAGPDDPLPGPGVRLLPGFDTYLLGYQSRDLVLARPHARRIHPGGGIIHPALLVDGRVLGTWRARRRRTGLTVEVTPFADLPSSVRPALAAEAADIARFLGLPGGELTITPEPPAA